MYCDFSENGKSFSYIGGIKEKENLGTGIFKSVYDVR